LILFHNFIIEKIGGRDSNINYYYEWYNKWNKNLSGWNHSINLWGQLASKYSNTSYLNKTKL
jgi:hypothetical protein